MMDELETRATLPAIRHYQATLLNEKMENPGKMDLRQLHARLPPHERTYLIERIEQRKQLLTRNPERLMNSNEPDRESVVATRSFGAVPRESHAYRAYMASMGTIEQELLNGAVQQRRDLPVADAFGRLRHRVREGAELLLPGRGRIVADDGEAADLVAIDGAPEFEMQEDVVGLGSYGRVLTVLFSDEAMPDESDEDDE